MEFFEKVLLGIVVLVIVGMVTSLYLDGKATDRRKEEMQARCARLMPAIQAERAADLAALCAQAQK